MAKTEIKDYLPIVGPGVIDDLILLSEKIQGKVIQNINSTAVGGGVAELLSRIIPFLKELGIDARWNVIKGDEKFFTITKKMHNALHGVDIKVTPDELSYFRQVNQENALNIDFTGDIIYIHDPQPIALIEKKQELQKKWIWRCHIDFTNPQPSVYNFLKPYIERYDTAVFSAPSFVQNIQIPQVLVSPSIDPLSDKNKELTEDVIQGILERFGIDYTRPIITQISRFDYLQDPIGVIKIFKKVKRTMDCQLVLAGGGASDDPEGTHVLEEVKKAAEDDPDIHVIVLPTGSDLEINGLQRASTVILQKSLKEGFGLTVTEALWKAKPVIASAVGGIPLQIVHKYSGILTYSAEGTYYYLKLLLNQPEYARELGLNGREHVRNNFLITRQLRDYILLFLSMFYENDIVTF